MADPPLLPAPLLCRLTTQTIARRVYYWPDVESTNGAAVRLAAMGEPHGTLVVTNQQTRGRGRQGRVWMSAPGKDLSFSLILRPDSAAASILPITLGFSAAVAEALSEVVGTAFDVKWPNDVAAHGRKVCGILAESATEGSRTKHVVVGIGINVNSAQIELPHAIRETATTCSSLAGGMLDLADVLSRVLSAIESAYVDFCRGGFVAMKPRYMTRLAMLGERVRFDAAGARYEATVADVADDGALLVTMMDGERRVLYDEEVHFLEK